MQTLNKTLTVAVVTGGRSASLYTDFCHEKTYVRNLHIGTKNKRHTWIEIVTMYRINTRYQRTGLIIHYCLILKWSIHKLG